MKYLLILGCAALAACSTAQPEFAELPGTTADVSITCAKQSAKVTGTSVHLFDGTFTCSRDGDVIVKPVAAR